MVDKKNPLGEEGKALESQDNYSGDPHYPQDNTGHFVEFDLNAGMEEPAKEPRFHVDEQAVWFYPPATKRNPDGTPVRICGKLLVTGRTRDDGQDNHGLVLEWKDPDGHKQVWVMPLEILAGDQVSFRAMLMRRGLWITPGFYRERLAEYVQSQNPEFTARCVDRVGWYKNSFVQPDETFGGS